MLCKSAAAATPPNANAPGGYFTPTAGANVQAPNHQSKLIVDICGWVLVGDSR